MGGAKKAGSRRDDSTDAERRLKKGIAKRVVQMDAELGQAIELLSACDMSKLPKEAQDAIALVSSAKTHTSHIAKKEKLDATDAARSVKEPDTSTPEEDDDLALSMAMAQDLMRSSEFGI